MLADGLEIALVDVRSATDFEAGHILLAVNLPAARLGEKISRLVPRQSTRVVLCGDASGLIDQAVTALQALGYSDLYILDGGMTAWSNSGFEIFGGTYSINNAFALCVERHYGTQRITAEELKSKIDSGAAITILDSRPSDEFHAESIPGAINLPLAELPYRIKDFVADPRHEIIVNCGGRARAVLGCQSLINAGVPNPLSALYYGTMGWDLAGYPLARKAKRTSMRQSEAARAWACQAAGQISRRFAVQSISREQLQVWRTESEERTVYVIDVRSRAEFDAGHLPECAWIPGGELIGLTEDHIATRNARLCLVDNDGARATLTASWMMQMGWPEVAVLDGGIEAYPGTGIEPESAAPVTATTAEDTDLPVGPGSTAGKAARHAGYRQTMEARERLPDQLSRDGTLSFRLPPLQP